MGNQQQSREIVTSFIQKICSQIVTQPYEVNAYGLELQKNIGSQFTLIHLTCNYELVTQELLCYLSNNMNKQQYLLLVDSLSQSLHSLANKNTHCYLIGLYIMLLQFKNIHLTVWILNYINPQYHFGIVTSENGTMEIMTNIETSAFISFVDFENLVPCVKYQTPDMIYIIGGIYFNECDDNNAQTPEITNINVINQITMMEYEGFKIKSDFSIAHINTEDMLHRDAQSNHHHNLDDDVIEAIYNPDIEHKECDFDQSLQQAMQRAINGIDMFNRYLQHNEVVMVCAWNSLNVITQGVNILQQPVTYYDHRYTRGLLFTTNGHGISEYNKKYRQVKPLLPRDVNVSDGIVICPRCESLMLIGESGPHYGLTEECPCGYQIAIDDHTYSHDLIVIQEGFLWSSVRSCNIQHIPYHNLINICNRHNFNINDFHTVGFVELDNLDIHHSWNIIALGLNEDNKTFLRNVRLLLPIVGRSDTEFITQDLRIFRRFNPLSAARLLKLTMLYCSDQLAIGSFGNQYFCGEILWPVRNHLFSLLARFGTVYGLEETILNYYNNICVFPCDAIHLEWVRHDMCLRKFTYTYLFRGDYRIYSYENVDIINAVKIARCEEKINLSVVNTINFPFTTLGNAFQFLNIEKNINQITDNTTFERCIHRNEVKHSPCMKMIAINEKIVKSSNHYGGVNYNEFSWHMRNPGNDTSPYGINPTCFETIMGVTFNNEVNLREMHDVHYDLTQALNGTNLESGSLVFIECVESEVELCDLIKTIHYLTDGLIIFSSNTQVLDLIDEFNENPSHFLLQHPSAANNAKSTNIQEIIGVEITYAHGSKWHALSYIYLPYMVQFSDDGLDKDLIFWNKSVIGMTTPQCNVLLSEGMFAMNHSSHSFLSHTIGFDNTEVIFIGKNNCLNTYMANYMIMVSTFGFIYNYATAYLLITKKITWCVVSEKEKNLIKQNVLSSIYAGKIILETDAEFKELSYSRSDSILNLITNTIYPIRGMTNNITRIIKKIATKTTMTYEEYISFYKKVQLNSRTNQDILNIFVQGTRGDRIPLEAVHKLFISYGLNSYLISLCDVKDSLQDLNLCETERGYELIPKFLQFKLNLMKENKPFLYPSYLGHINDKGIGFGLHPLKHEIKFLRSGMPYIYDFLLQFLPIHKTMIHICATNSYGYFPRSCDGINFLKTYPTKSHIRTKKGVLMGSSSIPVPDEYRTWEIIPQGNHNEILKEYSTVACAGGCGAVHTAKTSGVEKVIAWSDCIDRHWNDPLDCGTKITRQMPKHNYLIIPALIYKKKYAFNLLKHPNSWMDYIFFTLFSWFNVFTLLWQLIFCFHNLTKYNHMDISLSKTILGMVFRFDNNLLNVVCAKMALIGYQHAKFKFNLTNYDILKYIFVKFTQAIMSGYFAIYIQIGFSTRLALFLSVLSPYVLSLIYNFKGEMRFKQYKTCDKNVWLEFKLITFKWLPVGFHTRIHDLDEKKYYEGCHVYSESVRLDNGNVSLGNYFTLKSSHDSPGRSFTFAVKTSLLSCHLDSNAVTKNDCYSLIWNCVTLIFHMIYSNSEKLGLLAAILLFINMSYAFILLGLAFIMMFITSMTSFIIIGVCIKFKTFLPHRLLTYLETLLKLLTKINPRFNDGEDDLDISEEDLNKLKSASIELILSSITEGFEPCDVFLALRNSIVLLFNTDPKNRVHHMVHVNKPNFKESLRSLLLNINKYMINVGVPFRMVEQINYCFAFLINNCLNLTYIHFKMIEFIKTTCVSLNLHMISEELDNLLLCILDPDHTSRIKATWTPKYQRNLFSAMTFADFLYYTMPEQMDNLSNNQESIYNLNALLNMFKPEDEANLQDVTFQRKNFLPNKPRVTTGELEYDSLIKSVNYQIDPYLENRARKWLAFGGKQMIDGMWLTDENTMSDAITRRYTPLSKNYNQEESELLEEVVEAIYGKYPELFNDPGIVTPDVVLKNLKLKYSAGIPFMNRYKKRNDLLQTGWMDSIMECAYYCIEKGIFPPHHFHTFPKMQIVTKPRVIVAQDLLTTFISQITQLEMSKRQSFDIANFGMGAPMTSYHFGKIFTEIAKRTKFASADCTEFDSNSPSILFEGLTRLVLKGCHGNVKHPVYKIQAAKMFSLQHGVIHDLMNNTNIIKNRGGSTGESNTSFDNHWMYRLAIVMALTKCTNKSAVEVLENTTIHNTGDDNIFGSDLEFKDQDLVDTFKDLFGLTIKMESSNDITKLSYLHKKPVIKQHIHDAKLLNMVDTYDYLGVHLSEDIASKRTAILSRYSGLPNGPYALSMIKRDIGHLNLCIHNKILYGAILEDYANDVNLFVNYPNWLVFTTIHDDEGFAIGLNINKQTWRRVPNEVENRLKMILKQYKAPGYYDLFEQENKIYLKPKNVFSKFKRVEVNPLLSTVMTHRLNTLRNFIVDVTPDYAMKILSNQDRAIFSPLNTFYGWPVENFIYAEYVKEHGSKPNSDELAILFRQSMFPQQTDINSYLTYLSMPGVHELLTTDEERLKNKGIMIISYIIYLIINRSMELMTKIPILNVIINTFILFKYEIPRLYSHLNSLYWLSYGKPSIVVSNMIPKDPYIYQKTIALLIANSTPQYLQGLIGASFPSSVIGSIVNIFATIKTFRLMPLPTMIDTSCKNDWEIYTDEFANFIKHKVDKIFILDAPTGSGKSLKFPALMLANKTIYKRVFIVVPRKVLRDNYQNPFTITPVKILKMGIEYFEDELCISTYGHFINRLTNIPFVDTDLIMLDEFHEQDPIMINLYLLLLKTKLNVCITSATLTQAIYDHIPRFVLNYPCVNNYVRVERYDLPFINMILEAIKLEGKVKKYLFICKSVIQMNEISYILNDLGIMHDLMYSKMRKLPANSIVATQIVDTGINVPNLDVVVDCGLKVYHHRGKICVLPTTLSDEIQRKGRVGRFKSGVYYTNNLSGSSENILMFPNPLEYLTNNDLSQWYKDNYNLTTILTQFNNSNYCNGYVEIINYHNMNEEYKTTSKLWLCLKCYYYSHNEFYDIYSRIFNEGWTEEFEHFRKYIITNQNMITTGLLPPQVAAQFFDKGKRYRISLHGQMRNINGLKWTGDVLTYY